MKKKIEGKDLKEFYELRTCPKCDGYAAVDDWGIDLDGDGRAYLYTYLVCDTCDTPYKMKEYYEITEYTVEEEEE